MNKRIFYARKISLVFFLSLVLLFSADASLAAEQAPEAAEARGKISLEALRAEADAILKKQDETDRALLSELDSASYTFEAPLLVVDPYGRSPLSALMLFKTDKPAEISVRVVGKTKQADVAFDFTGYETRHIIPIYGLYAGYKNTLLVQAVFEDGTKKTNLIFVRTEALPKQLSELTIITRLNDKDAYQPGLNFQYTPKAAYDVNGDFRWFFSDFHLLQANSDNHDGRRIFAKGETLFGAALLYDFDLLGRVYNIYYSPYGVHHDIVRAENGNLLVAGSGEKAILDLIFEIDKADGTIVNKLKLSSVLQRTRVGSSAYLPHDWFHLNSIVIDKDGKIIISGRHQSAVVKLSWPEGEIDWILSNPKGFNKLFEPYLLTPFGEDFEWQASQHTPQILPDADNNPDTMDILLFDNGTGRGMLDRELTQKAQGGESSSQPNYSRAVQYRINEKTKQVREIWQFGSELGATYYSERCGNAMQLENGSVFISFNVSTKTAMGDGSIYTMYSNSCMELQKNGRIIWESYITRGESASGSYENYKTARERLYCDADNNYSLGIAPRVLIP